MPPRWLKTLLFVLAMTVQVFAPVATGMAAAHSIDTPGAGVICLKAAQADEGSAQPGQGRHHHHDDCALCQAFCDGGAPVAGRPILSEAPNAQWTLLRWTSPHEIAHAGPRNDAHQARAPPVFS